MSPTKKASGLIAVFFFGVGLFALRRCAPPPPPPDYSQAGNDGGTRPTGVPDRSITVTVNPRGNSFTDEAQTTLVCGTPYRILTAASATVENCEGYNFTGLYERARFAYEKRTRLWYCEQGCSPKRVRLLYYKAQCRNHRATVNMKFEILCARPGDEPPTAQILPTDIDFTQPIEKKISGENGDMTAPDRRGELITDQASGTSLSNSIECPSKRVFEMQYSENEPGRCASFATYEPVVKRAEQRNDDLLQEVNCRANCASQTKTIQRREWNCDPATSNVVVKLWTLLECK